MKSGFLGAEDSYPAAAIVALGIHPVTRCSSRRPGFMFFAPADRPTVSGPSARKRQRERRGAHRVDGASGPLGRLEDVQKVAWSMLVELIILEIIC